ncbi:MAG: hypothetical protein O7E52_03160 [Candidatus Poribacteria bacterium]|nr:hypothetical protein [Candidatus Poribacteria bacterium]
MNETRIKQQVEQCIDELRQGKLTEGRLRQILDSLADMEPKRQDLLYLQASGTSLASGVVGMSIVLDGQISDGPSDPEDWPYQTVIDAVRDGWRIIKFPDMALLMDEERTYGLGCEFILEKWRSANG